MINVEMLLVQVPGLLRQDLERWILNAWVRPDGRLDGYVFHDIDVARVRLIQELRDDLDINEAALPVVLLLLDQLYDLRRRSRRPDDSGRPGRS
jgi:chaperone modulatory protein CbpM